MHRLDHGKIKFAAHANNNKEACMAGICIMQRLQDLYRSFVMTHACMQDIHDPATRYICMSTPPQLPAINQALAESDIAGPAGS